MRKLISILLCLAMILGSAASVFADTSQGTATTLRLEKTEGKVAITKAGGKSVTVKEGTRLYDGYEIKTDKKSAAYVSLDSAKAVMLDASTDVTIKKSGKKLEIMLKAGTVLLNVEDKLAGNEELNIRTTNSVTGIRGTIVQASFNPKTQNSEIYLFEGMTTGKYLAPDGSWYTQTLTTGSWLASGMGMLAENPEYNGWTVGPNGEWIYTNNKIEGTQFRQWRWSADQGWFTFDINTGAVTKQEAWPFTFKDLQPRVQKEILGTPSMLTRGQEHLDLYPELAEKEITATRETAGIVLTQQEEEIEKQDAAIQAAYEEGNGGNTVNNLFKEEAPSVPTYPMVFMMDDPETVANAARYTTQYYQEGEAVTAPAAPTREGYTFAGWNSPLPTAKATTEEMVYATWTINQYTLSFVDSDGITELADSITADYGTPVTAPANPTKTGYTFTGWDATIPATMPGKDITFKAKWGIDQHTITFNTNGGSTIAPITQDYGTTVTAPAAPTRTGYTFTGWSPAVPATMPAADTTSIAQWSAREYSIIYNSNGGTGDPYTQTFTYDDEAGEELLLTPEEANFTRTGYYAFGWAGTTSATAVEFTNDDSTFTSREALAALADSDNNIILYAVWLPETYSVTFDTNDGIINSGNITTYTYGVGAVLPTDVVLTGNTFGGWYDNNDLVGDEITAISTTDFGEKTFYAKWEPNTYSVSLVTNGGTINANDVTEYTFYSGATLPTAADITRAGYIFAGWYANEDFSGSEITEIGEIETGDKTYYAKWTATLNVNFTKNAMNANITGFAIGDTPVTANADGSYTVPENTDFTFTLNGKYKITDASGAIITNVNNTGTYRASSSTTLIVDEMPENSREVTVKLMYNPDKASIVSYSNNVLAVTSSAAAATDTIFTLADNGALTFTISEDESYGVTGAEGAERSAANPNEYSVAAGGSTAILLVNKLSSVSSTNGTIVLAADSDVPYKTASDGSLLFKPDSKIIIDTSAVSDTCMIIVDTDDPGTPAGLINSQFIALSGSYYKLIYAPDGYKTVSLIRPEVDVNVTSATIFHNTINGDNVYFVAPDSDFVFTADGANVIVNGEPSARTPQADGYHITVTDNMSINITVVPTP